MDVAVQFVLSASASPVCVIAVVYEHTDADREFHDAVERAAKRINANRPRAEVINSMAAAQFLATLHEADARSWNKTKVLCSEGLDSVFVTAWRDGTFSYVPLVPPLPLQCCGADFDPTDYSAPRRATAMKLIVSLAVGLRVAAMLVVALLAVVYMRSQHVLSFLNIMRPDLEINECVG
eukprot:m51a1_g5832 hypothetical protein (179) ;mRNA; r:272299-272993